ELPSRSRGWLTILPAGCEFTARFTSSARRIDHIVLALFRSTFCTIRLTVQQSTG
ncbi:hypothetical protein FOL46_002284, partial [Perkinsus olseni]